MEEVEEQEKRVSGKKRGKRGESLRGREYKSKRELAAKSSRFLSFSPKEEEEEEEETRAAAGEGERGQQQGIRKKARAVQKLERPF